MSRRSLRMPQWELWQVVFGLAIPFLITLHVMGTRVAELTHDVNASYASTLLTFWYSAPWIGVLQTTALIVVWAHGCIGIHFWLRNKALVPRLDGGVPRLRHPVADAGARRLCRRRQRDAA